MAENLNLNNVATFQNDTSAVNTVNSNFSAITTAMNDVLSRSGISPNQMSSTLDMNNNQIINLPFPTTLNSPARLQDVTNAQNITIITATTGTSGHVVGFLDGANTWSAPQTISLPSLGTGTGLNISETVSGTNASGVNINNINIVDSLAAGPGFSIGLQVVQGFGTSSATGGRSAILGQANLLSATNASNTNRDYVGVAGTSTAVSADNGTSPTASGTSAGTLSGGSFLTATSSAATSLFTVCGATFNTQMAAGSSTWSKALAEFSSNPSDAVNGTGINSMLWLFNQAGAAAKWTNAILIDNGGGTGSFPLSSTATIFKVGTGSVANGIDFSNTVFSANAFVSSAFSVNGSGAVSTGSSGVSSGQLVFNGVTSGSINVTTNATSNLLTISQPIQVGVIGTTAGQLTLAGQTSGSAILSASATGGTLQMGAGNVLIDTGGNMVTNGALRVGNSTAPVSGGDTAHAYLFGPTITFGIFTGVGPPTISAAQGSLYLNVTGSTTSTRAYMNTNGSTGWTAITTAT